MNTVLESLLYHSGLTAQGGWDAMDQYQRECVERFAELIVQDACGAIKEWKKEPFPFDESTAVWILKTHFGVK